MIAQQGRRSVEFRAARANEVQRAAALLSAAPSEPANYFVALTPRPVERIVAAAAWSDAAVADGAPADARFDWTVIPDWRGDNFPQAFLQPLLQVVRERGRRSLRAMRLVDPRSWEVDAFRRAGFQEIARHEHYCIDGAACRPRHDRIIDRLQVEAMVPDGRSIESITPANAHATAHIVGRHGLLAPQAYWSGLRHGLWQEFSAVVMHNELAEGVVLASSKDLATVSVHVLAAVSNEEIFSGLICFLLLQVLRKRCDAAGVSAIYFWAEPERSPATRSLSARLGAERVGETVQYGLCL